MVSEVSEAPWGGRRMRRLLLPGYEVRRTVSAYQEGIDALQKQRTQPEGVDHATMGSTPVRTRMDLRWEQRGPEA